MTLTLLQKSFCYMHAFFNIGFVSGVGYTVITGANIEKLAKQMDNRLINPDKSQHKEIVESVNAVYQLVGIPTFFVKELLINGLTGGVIGALFLPISFVYFFKEFFKPSDFKKLYYLDNN